MWSRPSRNRIFRCQGQIEIRSGLSGAQYPGFMERGPTDPMLVAILTDNGKRVPQQMRWGLIPWWAKDSKIGFSSINARAETVDTTPAFRDAWKKGQRCLVITDGFLNGRSPKSSPMRWRWQMIGTWSWRIVGRMDGQENRGTN